MHTFFVCSKVIECWDKISIGTIIRELLLGANNFSTILFDLFTRLKEQDKLSADSLELVEESKCKALGFYKHHTHLHH